MKITNHHELRNKDCAIDCSSPKLTDQSDKQSCDINYIMQNYQKTGMLSHVTAKLAKYQDNTQTPQLETAYKIIRDAEDAFDDLPVMIRKMMDYDPSKLEFFLRDPANSDILIKHGLLKKPEIVEKPLEPTKTAD